MVGLVFVILFGLSINSYNTGGVATGQEAYNDIKAGITEGYSHEKFTSFELND